MQGRLYYGDNLDVLKQSAIPDESIDLIYLDPPFNSNVSYNILFKSPEGVQSHAQAEAFSDSWHWSNDAELAFDEVLTSRYSEAAIVLRAIRSALGESDLMAYLSMMAVRLVHLHRVLKPTGSLYLHCDPTASHYLKALLDGIFGIRNFRTEISWRRQSAHNDAKQGRKQYGNVRDIILFYTKGKEWTWNPQYTSYSEEYTSTMYRFVEDGTGRRYRTGDLTAAKTGGDTRYEWRVKRPLGGKWAADLKEEYRTPQADWEYKGILPYGKRIWAYSKENMRKYALDGRIVYSESGMPNYKRYLDEMPGVTLQNDWNDIKPASGKEFLGYPTQKPLALLERIILASSNKGDTILDPFCGCGTATHAAQKLGRNWIGIDITHVAVSLIEKRLKEAFPNIQYEVHGTPKDSAGAEALAERDKYEFQKWIVPRIGGQLYQGGKKGMDRGVDGYIHFRDADRKPHVAIISVKGGKNVSSPMIRDLKATVEREQAKFGVFVTLTSPTREMEREAASAGIYETGGQRIPKVQILTIDDIILRGKAPQVPFGHTEGLPVAVRESTTSQPSFDWQEEGHDNSTKKPKIAGRRKQSQPEREVHSGRAETRLRKRA